MQFCCRQQTPSRVCYRLPMSCYAFIHCFSYFVILSLTSASFCRRPDRLVVQELVALVVTFSMSLLRFHLCGCGLTLYQQCEMFHVNLSNSSDMQSLATYWFISLSICPTEQRPERKYGKTIGLLICPGRTVEQDSTSKRHLRRATANASWLSSWAACKTHFACWY
jgi:hypothetical protein